MKEFVRHEKLMGSHFTLGLMATDASQAEKFLQEGIDIILHLEKLLSECTVDSETTKFNQHLTTEKIMLDPICFQLMQRCVNLSKLCSGDFDITICALKKVNQFKKSDFKIPEEAAIKEALKAVGYEKIGFNKDGSVYKKHPALSISFAAVGKEFAADVVKQKWLEAGIESGYINVSGDLCAWGQKEDGKHWNIGISHPDKKDQFILKIPLPNHAIATLGHYEQYFMHEGKRFAHNINPHTGKPIRGIKSVSVISPGAELSDALATAVFVKGIAKGMAFIEQLPQTHCVIINDENKLYLSKHLKYEMVAS